MKGLHPGAVAGCPHCGGLAYTVRRDGEWAVAAACECIGTCPTCRGSGFVAVSDEFRASRKRCTCALLTTRVRLFNEIGIPARHAHSTRKGFEHPGKLMPPFMAVSKWIMKFEPREECRGLVLHGPVGLGKTHLLCAMLHELVFTYGVTARFVEFSHLLADLKSGFDIGRGSASLIDPLVRVDVLAIDELGKGRNTEFEGTVVDELVSRRYNAMRPILATTNWAPGEATGLKTPNLADAAARGDATYRDEQDGARRVPQGPTLPDRIGSRVYSRLRETCDFIALQGDDYRETIARRPKQGKGGAGRGPRQSLRGS